MLLGEASDCSHGLLCLGSVLHLFFAYLEKWRDVFVIDDCMLAAVNGILLFLCTGISFI